MTIDNDSRVLQNSGDILFHQTHSGMKPNSEENVNHIAQMSKTSLQSEQTDIINHKEKQTVPSLSENQPP